MIENSNNKYKFAFFGLIVLVFIVGGFVLMQKSAELSDDKRSKNKVEEKESEVDIRLDKEKDYIYFTDNDVVVGELDIAYMNVVTNFEDKQNIAKTLNDESKAFKEAITYDEEMENPAYDKLSFAEYKKYDLNVFEDYLSLIVHYYNYKPESLVSYEKSQVYVFDKNTGEIITDDTLLSKYGLTKDDVNSKIRTYVEGQDLVKEGETLDVDATVNANQDFNLYVNKLGKLCITIIVKSDQKDYNDTIVLN